MPLGDAFVVHVIYKFLWVMSKSGFHASKWWLLLFGFLPLYLSVCRYWRLCFFFPSYDDYFKTAHIFLTGFTQWCVFQNTVHSRVWGNFQNHKINNFYIKVSLVILWKATKILQTCKILTPDVKVFASCSDLCRYCALKSQGHTFPLLPPKHFTREVLLETIVR